MLIQWHHPTLSPAHTTNNNNNNNKGQILLYYVMSQHPLSARSPLVTAVEKLRAGQRLVCLEKLLAVHALLSAACADMSEALGGSPSPITTPRKKGDQKVNKGAANGLHQQMLLEKTRQCCTEIKRLFCPLMTPAAPMAEVPFEASLQTLRNLECCFNPSLGATLTDKGLITWLLPHLGPTEGI